MEAFDFGCLDHSPPYTLKQGLLLNRNLLVSGYTSCLAIHLAYYWNYKAAVMPIGLLHRFWELESWS